MTRKKLTHEESFFSSGGEDNSYPVELFKELREAALSVPMVQAALTAAQAASTQEQLSVAIGKPTTEAGLVQAIEKWLAAQPNTWYFKSVGGPYQQPGIPDIIGCKDGRLFGIEVKKPGRLKTEFRPKDTREHLQQRIIKQINDAGGLAFFADSLALVVAKLSE